ncbi:MAG: rod shape-determining protein MreC [Thermoanaerobaculia bacterium]|nr:rod shape-determining protein MreC [Thermoanaerobaculia bacterium]
MAAPLSPARPALVLATLLGSCVILLSLQVRRSGQGTLAEEWALDASSALVRGSTGVRSAAGSLVGSFATRESLREENAALRERVAALEARLHSLHGIALERDRLVRLLGAVPAPPPGTRPARIVVIETAGPFQTALLDRGRVDGVEPGGVVVGEEGLLGRVVSAGERGARVQLLSDRTAATGVLLPRTGRVAVARGDGASGAAIQYVPAIADVTVNEEVVTSGTDGVYPRGLLLGRIAAVRRPGASLFLELPVDLAADPAREPLVFVIPPVRPDAPAPGATPAGRSEP